MAESLRECKKLELFGDEQRSFIRDYIKNELRMIKKRS